VYLETCFDERTSNYDCNDETSLRDDSLTTTPSEESSQLLARTTDRPRWIPVFQQKYLYSIRLIFILYIL
jgi:hypothetical protein